jgi:hypothetical protein
VVAMFVNKSANESKFGRKHPWRSSIKIAHFVPIRLQTWPPQAILVSDWLISKNLSLKPLGQMNRNFADQDEMSNFYKGPAIDASYQVSIHFAKRFQRRFFKIGQSETRIAYGGHVC